MDILYYLALGAAVAFAVWLGVRKKPKGIDDSDWPDRGG